MVRERDVALQGSTNPNLADFGQASEARQYSGRATEVAWQCPFARKEA
jgi:FPC/CPF motif-containing protein YcgG